MKMEKEINFKKIEKKWQDKWERKKVFEPEIDKKRKKFFGTFPYPYVNLSPHIGHFYSLMRLETFSRYKRARGFNVLFPQAWHATGSPIVAAANRVKEKEPKIIASLKREGFSDKEIKEFVKPEHWIKVFGKKWINDLKAMGCSIDWRRNFITTSLNPPYDNFIKWQFRKLKKKGYVEKGKHPVVWDPKTNMPVGDHDRVKGEGETPQDFIWCKFKMKNSDLILMAGTTRPDALYGQTNLWVDPKGDYVIVKVKDEKWVVGREVVEKIKEQYAEDIKIIKKISPKELIGKWVKGPLVNRELHVLPAYFIKSDVGSGIVYSALEDPVDLYELEKIQSSSDLIKEFKLDKKEVERLKPIDIIKVPGMGSNLGKRIGEEFGVKSSEDVHLLEKAKGELNRRVFRKGVMMGNCGKCAGMTVPKAQEFLKKNLVKDKESIMFYELTGEVVSRSLTECIIKVVSNQWFIKYGDKKWKKQVHDALKDVKLYPEIVREQFEYVIDWLRDWACTREYGLGTRLPFDEKWLIESLSDSTIYMAYYTIAHLIKKLKIKEVNDELFDYVFLGKGKGKKEWKKLKEEFEYWYPLDFRNSGKDLVQNHLTFFLFNHTAIFPKKYWPKSIGVNGWVKVEGEKMSKSLGNLIPLREMKEKFGADVSRLTILNGGEGLDDPNWDSRFAENLNKKFEHIFSLVKNYGKGENKTGKIDEWIENKLSVHVNDATKFMEGTLFRSAIQKIYFELVSDIKWYLKRTNKPNKKILNKVIESLIILMQPFTPHLAEELWEKIGKKKLVSLEKWPEFKVKKFEDTEALIKKLLEDVNNIKRILKKDKAKVYVYVLPKELELYKGLGGVEVFSVADKKKHDPENKSKKARPGKPAIYLE